MVAIEIKGCPKQIHWLKIHREVKYTRYGIEYVRHEVDIVSDPDCPCRQKIREELRNG